MRRVTCAIPCLTLQSMWNQNSNQANIWSSSLHFKCCLHTHKKGLPSNLLHLDGTWSPKYQSFVLLKLVSLNIIWLDNALLKPILSVSFEWLPSQLFVREHKKSKLKTSFKLVGNYTDCKDSSEKTIEQKSQTTCWNHIKTKYNNLILQKTIPFHIMILRIKQIIQ